MTRGFPRKPPDCEALAEARNSFSAAVFLQTSGLRGFGTELISD